MGGAATHLRDVISREVHNGKDERILDGDCTDFFPADSALSQQQANGFQRHLDSAWWIRHGSYFSQVLLLDAFDGYK